MSDDSVMAIEGKPPPEQCYLVVRTRSLQMFDSQEVFTEFLPWLMTDATAAEFVEDCFQVEFAGRPMVWFNRKLLLYVQEAG